MILNPSEFSTSPGKECQQWKEADVQGSLRSFRVIVGFYPKKGLQAAGNTSPSTTGPFGTSSRDWWISVTHKQSYGARLES